MMRLLFLFFLFPLFAREDIIVEVRASDQLTPLYLAPIASGCSGFSSSYCHQIHQLLRFDFEHNARTTLVSNSLERELLSQKEIYDSQRWRELGVQIYLKPEISKKQFLITSLDTKTGHVKRLKAIELTGNFTLDRTLIHQVSDTVFRTLFGEEGIASRRILYTLRMKKSGDSKDWITEVWQADYDFGNPQKLTSEESLCVTPTSIPRSEDCLYVSYKIGQPKLYRTTLREGAKRLSYLKGNQLMPAVSPLGNQIAFISDVTGNPDLFIQDFSVEEGLKGKARQAFHAPGAVQGCPTYSPDGQQIAFVSNKDGTARVYYMDIPPPGAKINSLKPKLVSKKNRGNTSPVWSPDGRKIAYSAMTSGVRQIWVYDMVKREEWQLTHGGMHKENPSWAPNSLHLLYNSVGDGIAELYLIDLMSKEATKISSGMGEKRFPSW